MRGRYPVMNGINANRLAMETGTMGKKGNRTMKLKLAVMAALCGLVLAAAPARAQDDGGYRIKLWERTGDISTGYVNADGKGGFTLGGSGVILFRTSNRDAQYEIEPAPFVAFGVRPEFAWQRFSAFGGNANDYLFTLNGQAEFPNWRGVMAIPKEIVPFGFLGGGLMFNRSNIGTGSTSGNGGVFNVGVGVKMYALVNVYLAPTYTYMRGFGEVKGDYHRLTVGLGISLDR